MPANSSPTARQLVERILREMFPGAKLIIEPAAGGFLVGVVRSDFSTHPGRARELEVLKRVSEANVGVQESVRAAIVKIAFYSDENAVYAEDAMLRIQRSTFRGAIRVPHPSPQDAHVRAHELQAEALAIDPQSRFTCQVRPVDSNRKILPTYVQFDLLGMALEVHHVDDIGDGIWVVHIGSGPFQGVLERQEIEMLIESAQIIERVFADSKPAPAVEKLRRRYDDTLRELVRALQTELSAPREDSAASRERLVLLKVALNRLLLAAQLGPDNQQKVAKVEAALDQANSALSRAKRNKESS